MAGQDQQLIVRDQDTLGDERMGGNGGPIEVFPGAGNGPHFYVNAPQFHWHQVATEAVDEAARMGLQQIAHECFQFGRFVEQRLSPLDEARGNMAWVPDAVGALRGRLDVLEAARHRGEMGGRDWSGVLADVQHQLSQLDSQRQEAEEGQTKLQQDVQSVRADGRKRQKELESLMLEDGEARRQDFQTELNRQVAKVRSEVKSGESKIQTWVQELVATEIQRLEAGKLKQTLTASEMERQYGTTIQSLEEQVADLKELVATNADTITRMARLMEKMGTRLDELENAEEEEEEQGSTWPEVTAEFRSAESSGERQTETPTWSSKEFPAKPAPIPMGFGSPLPSPSVPQPSASVSQFGISGGSMGTMQMGIGQLKLEAPARFNGARRPGAQKWIEQMTTWMSLMNYPREQWILISSTRLEGHVSSWFSAQQKSIQQGQRTPWLSWEQYSQDLIKTFAPLDEEEDARRQLKELKQTGRVSGYTAKFNELCYKVPDMTEKDKFSMYFLGLVPRLQGEVGLRLEDNTQRTVDNATKVAQRAEEYLKIKYTKDEGQKKKNDADKKGKKWTPGGKQGGHVATVETTENAPQVNAVTSKNKRGGKRQTWRGRGNGRGGRGNRGPPKCFCCNGEHLLRDCPEWERFRNQNRQNAQPPPQQGNA